MWKIGAIIILLIGIGGLFYIKNTRNTNIADVVDNLFGEIEQSENLGGTDKVEPFPLSIEALRNGEYPGSDLIIEQELAPGSNYQRYIVSYKSEGLKQFALLTVPNADPPEGGYPAIVFNHGYIPPAQYKTTERYVAYTDAFSRNGYVVLKPDYRGHGNSEGQASGGYGSNGYTIDVLNAVGSIKKLSSPSTSLGEDRLPLINPNSIGMWGHSMGGFITLRSMVVSKDIKAGVIWGGVVGSYSDLFDRWRRRSAPSGTPSIRGGSWRQQLSNQYGTPEANPEFWDSLSANNYLSDISGPIELHHGENDTSVPVEFSLNLEQQLKAVDKEVELFVYSGDDHNISANLSLALSRSVEFFDRYLK